MEIRSLYSVVRAFILWVTWVAPRKTELDCFHWYPFQTITVTYETNVFQQRSDKHQSTYWPIALKNNYNHKMYYWPCPHFPIFLTNRRVICCKQVKGKQVNFWSYPQTVLHFTSCCSTLATKTPNGKHFSLSERLSQEKPWQPNRSQPCRNRRELDRNPTMWVQGLERWSRGYKHLLHMQRTWVQFPAHKSGDCGHDTQVHILTSRCTCIHINKNKF